MKKKFTWTKIEGDYYAYYGDEELGYIEYYKKWKRWVWNGDYWIILSLDCILEIAFKLKLLEIDKNKK